MGKKDKKNIVTSASNYAHTKSVIIHKREDEATAKLSNKALAKNTAVITSCNLNQDLDKLLEKYGCSCIILVQPLVMLDLNGILCIKARRGDKPESGGVYREGIGQVSGKQVIPRSDLHDLLWFLDNNFTLAVWTSAMLKNATKIVDLLFPPEIKERLLFIWGQEFCKVHKPKRIASYKDIVYMKSLEKVWDAFPLWNEMNTLLIDDSPEKCLQYVSNTIHPPPILGTIDDNGEVDHDAINQNNQFNFFAMLSKFWCEQIIITKEKNSENDKHASTISSIGPDLRQYLEKYSHDCPDGWTVNGRIIQNIQSDENRIQIKGVSLMSATIEGQQFEEKSLNDVNGEKMVLSEKDTSALKKRKKKKNATHKKTDYKAKKSSWGGWSRLRNEFF